MNQNHKFVAKNVFCCIVCLNYLVDGQLGLIVVNSEQIFTDIKGVDVL